MMNFGYNKRWIRLVKDLLFAGVAVWLITKSSVLAVLVGILGLGWYGRDAWFQIKALWQEKHYQAPTPEKPADNGSKITVTNLEDAKEVEFKKED